MDITSKEQGGCVVLSIRGSVDASNADQLRSALLEAAETGGSRLVVDMEGVPFIDSSGLGTLVYVFKTLRVREGDLRLASMRPAVSRIFELTRLDRVFMISPDTMGAVASFAA